VKGAGQAVIVTSGWLSGRIGYVQRIERDTAVVRVMGSGDWPFPSIETLPLQQIERVDLQALQQAAMLLQIEEAPF
jgi:hypothetical protein